MLRLIRLPNISGAHTVQSTLRHMLLLPLLTQCDSHYVRFRVYEASNIHNSVMWFYKIFLLLRLCVEKPGICVTNGSRLSSIGLYSTQKGGGAIEDVG